MIEVKELEWERKGSRSWEARPPCCGKYIITQAGGGTWYAVNDDLCFGVSGFASDEAAKAACQADFSRRVLACVTVSEADIRADERERLISVLRAEAANARSLRGAEEAIRTACWLRSQTPPAGGGTAAQHKALLAMQEPLARTLLTVRDALEHLPAEALGMAESGGAEWPIRDDIINSVNHLLKMQREIPPAGGG